jgi:NCK-associated protein 1
VLGSCVTYELSEKNEKVRVYLKPSEMLNLVNAHMAVLVTVENYTNVDLTDALKSVLLEQTQISDSNGQPTITKNYCEL